MRPSSLSNHRRSSRGQRDDVICTLAQGKGRPLAVTHSIVPRFESVPIGHVFPDKAFGPSVKADVILKAGEPIGQARGMVGACRSVECQASLRPKTKRFGPRRPDETCGHGRVIAAPDRQPLDVVSRDRREPASAIQASEQANYAHTPSRPEPAAARNATAGAAQEAASITRGAAASTSNSPSLALASRKHSSNPDQHAGPDRGK